MKVSVIIPCFNYGHFLPETLQSLVSQTYPNWEALVIDDGSEDSTPHLMAFWKERDPRIRYFRQEKGGVSKARNLGLTLSTGDLIQFLDADDLLSPEKIEIQVTEFRRNPGLDISYTENFYFPDGSPQLRYLDQEFTDRNWLRKFSGYGAYALENLIQNNLAVISSPMVKKELTLRFGGFSTDFSHCEDWKFWLQCALEGARIHFASHSQAFTLIRVHAKSVSQNVKIMQYGELKLRAWLERELKATSSLTEKEKNGLIWLNQSRRTLLVKHMIYLNSLTDLSHLREMKQLVPWYLLLLFYVKALNHKRKKNHKIHASHRHYPIVQRAK